MTLNAALWARLEDHGVTVAHMEMLLRALETHGNGSIAWHIMRMAGPDAGRLAGSSCRRLWLLTWLCECYGGSARRGNSLLR